ncbi:hypothetical protein G6N82_12640 [Altererythrobacter sp. BO-6]|uniref:hypothetical protein n=1 Tax=Altererythrobacter sp. BO-6 TaxID=2604537 RepID=UPI0013E11782|nr:hypothetical protein [Altererythrobacter sp. BO-6]QIG54886.1 hypothetical protein G6N82_12640 [Altererythrobacter sp. BO-6]
MPNRELFRLPKLRASVAADAPATDDSRSSAVSRSEMMQRLQVGLAGLAAMVLLVGLANIIQDRARVSDELAVPEAAPTVAPSGPPALSDPLADAGVVPDMPAEPAPAQSPAIVPEQGNGTNDQTP